MNCVQLASTHLIIRAGAALLISRDAPQIDVGFHLMRVVSMTPSFTVGNEDRGQICELTFLLPGCI